jgi:hypothetical protein
MIIKLLIFIGLILYVYYNLKKNITIDLKPDIVISPGGFNGFYQLGICHYIKNNFDYSNKKIIGFSSGSWAGLFLCLNHERTNECVRKIFSKIRDICPLHTMPAIFQKSIEDYDYSDFNISNLNIGMTNVHTKSIYVHNEFLTVKNCIDCCIGSSFVPYVTYKDFFYFYNHKCVVDGGFYYKNYLKTVDTNKTLVINYKLFRPKYNVHHRPFVGFVKPNRTLYQLYLLGYNNARNNHDYLKRYFHSDS